jgi:predicted Zn-dependent peptidase
MKHLFSIILLSLFTTGLLAQLDRSTPPEAAPAPQINIGEYEKFTLKNGLQVFVVEDHKLPMVAYSLTLDIDPVYEGEAAGYVSLAGDLMRSGTTNRPKAEIDESIDFIGATLNTYAQGIYGRSLKKHNETLLELMADVLLNPTFPQEELEKSLKQMETAIQAEKNEPSAIANNIASVLRYGPEDPYGEVVSEKNLTNITTHHLKTYHQTYFRPNVAYLVIVGDINVKEAKKQANKYFGQWEKAEVPQHQYTNWPAYEAPKVAIANRDGANQSTIMVTHTIPMTPGHPNAIKASVMNQILGGGSFNTRLFQNLREDKAYTYGAYSRLSSDKRIGYFSASAQVRTSVTDSAIHEILYEMERMQTELVPAEDLELIKNMMTGNFSRSLEDPQTIANFALNIERYNLPADYYRTYLEKVAAVSAEDVMAMAKEYLNPEKAVILAVGEADKIEAVMRGFSPVGDVTRYDFYGHEVSGAVEVTDISAVDVINTYLNAIGGLEAINDIQDVTTTATAAIQGMELKMVTRQKAPNKLLVETMMGNNVLSKQVFNGEKGKVTSPMGEQELEGEMLEQMKEGSAIVGETNYFKEGFSLELQGLETIDDRECYKILVTRPSGNESTAYYGVADGLKYREVSSTPQGNMVTNIKTYEEVEGYKFPKAISQSVGPQTFDVAIDSIEINTGLGDELFED